MTNPLTKDSDRKINILFVIFGGEVMGGAERLVYNLALKLDRNLINPAVASFSGFSKEFTCMGIPLYHIPKKKRIDISTIQRFGDIIRDNDIDIINAHHFMSLIYSFYGSKIKNRRKLIYTEHSEWELRQIPLKWKILGGYLLSLSDGAVGVNAKVSDAIRNKFKLNPSKTFTIQNGVDLDSFAKGVKGAVLRKNLGLGDVDKVIGIVANFREVKNHIFLLKAFYELAKNCTAVKLLLIGQSFKGNPEDSEREILNFLNEKGLSKNVLFLGYRTDIPDLLRVMDIFCLTSFREGLPIALIEAMAAGLPVVGTDVEGIRDVILSGRNGFLVKLDDVDGLRNALHTLVQDDGLRRRFGEESRSLAVNTYSLKRCVKEYQDLFISVADV